MVLCAVGEQMSAMGTALGECGPLPDVAAWDRRGLTELWKSDGVVKLGL